MNDELLKAVEDALNQWDQCDDALAMTEDFQDAMANLRRTYAKLVLPQTRQ